MTRPGYTSRRNFLQLAAAAGAATISRQRLRALSPLATAAPPALLSEFGYRDVELAGCLQQKQFEETQAVLMGLNEDSLLKPFRLRAGMPAPGADLGGWYDQFAGYDYRHGVDHGFAPAATFGQWISALARGYAATGSEEKRAKVERLLEGYSKTIGPGFYQHFRFPAYTYDKLVQGLIDAHQFCAQADAFAILDRTTDAALPHLPPRALDRGSEMCSLPHDTSFPGDESFCWDESYTLPESLFIAYARGAGDRYRALGVRYLKDDTYFDPLSEGKNVLPGKHAYSYANALSSAMQAYLVMNSEKHLLAAKNAFQLIQETQSFATGGWGPDEMFVSPTSGALGESLLKTHNSFETPCGSYAHFKLTRYLLRVTGEAQYGDSMERVMYNTVLGVKPLQPDGCAFYYSDYNTEGNKVYYRNDWPCCSGTLPEVAADYGISSYFQDEDGVLVNLYIPSTLHWRQGGIPFTLTQSGNYPFAEQVQFTLSGAHHAEFSIAFRIPGWAGAGASILVNDKSVSTLVTAGSFVTVRRKWKSGDRIVLELPMSLRLEAVDVQHPETVALLYGPLVLFPITNSVPAVTRAQLLSATRTAENGGEWTVNTAGGSLRMLSFPAIGEEQYSTYLNVV
jgi:hypothetical protein